jgi:uncharacterized protein (TIGR03118 family)
MNKPIALVEAVESRVLMSASASTPAIAQTNLISDGAIPAQITDSNVVNAWGIATGNVVNGIIWIGNNGSGTSTLFNGATNSTGAPVVAIPGPGGAAGGTVTGVSTNPSLGFTISENGARGAVEYVFVTEDGTISGWNFNVDQTHALMLKDNSATGAVYKGDAITKVGNKTLLYVANFHSGKIEVYDQTMRSVAMPFKDPHALAGYAPFNVAALKGSIFVTYAKQDDAKHHDVAGAGNGFVDQFTTSGKFIKRLATGGDLNSPWGMAVAPSTFGKFAGDILVGNFGDGKINVLGGKGVIGQLQDANGNVVAIDGLWGLDVGDGIKSHANRLYFAAGPNSEQDGLFGFLTVSGKVAGKTGTPASSGGNTNGYTFGY